MSGLSGDEAWEDKSFESLRLVGLLRSLKVLPDSFGLLELAVIEKGEEGVSRRSLVKDQHWLEYDERDKERE